MIKLFKKNKGQAILIITIAVAVIITSATIFAGHLTLSQLRQSANIIGSIISFDAAGSGLECVSYWFDARKSESEIEESLCGEVDFSVSPPRQIGRKITLFASDPSNYVIVTPDLFFNGDLPLRFLTFGSYRSVTRGICLFYDPDYRCF